MESSAQRLETGYSPKDAEAVTVLKGIDFALETSLLPIVIERYALGVVESGNDQKHRRPWSVRETSVAIARVAGGEPRPRCQSVVAVARASLFPERLCFQSVVAVSRASSSSSPKSESVVVSAEEKRASSYPEDNQYPSVCRLKMTNMMHSKARMRLRMS
ncbi:hypothetical protein Dsin_019151 [Dipteronia sinensis]|uniref:Uncharacterized protein n=1 Tax=Dipteronia sinensis TaxID=43782 RepID=A0AAE0E2G8_9ROSI|nr:hypothetical protein Dsin_019151 [Dipteronia sinensis]